MPVLAKFYSKGVELSQLNGTNILQKTDYNEVTGDFWFKDGLCLVNLDKHYELKGLNELAFEWRTSETSFFTQVK
jgi:hypothetical protein